MIKLCGILLHPGVPLLNGRNAVPGQRQHVTNALIFDGQFLMGCFEFCFVPSDDLGICPTLTMHFANSAVDFSTFQYIGNMYDLNLSAMAFDDCSSS